MNSCLEDLAALGERGLSGMAPHRRMRRFAPAQNVEPRDREIQSALQNQLALARLRFGIILEKEYSTSDATP